ncbi:MAG TPA: DUF2619 domain-containing protein [Peptococcaceae bacterium]|nr:MAG: hypothetical protein XD50_0398 [Clostridia bacterium 41_269]HBT19839.1 DUF2619 domain-containing protein [Peptococcaceae bacterium]
MFFVKDKYVFGMALVRFFSAFMEFSAAVLMLKLNRVDKAMQVNAFLALVGPIVLITATGIGLAGLAGKTSPYKLILIALGVFLIVVGARK